MAYHIYTTKGIILKRSTFGEANLLLHILTEDLGLIMASARSARLSSSKLRPALQEYADVSITCIKGKNGWKVTNVAQSGSFFYDNPKFTHHVMSQVVSLLLKMIPGEAPNKEIFQTVKVGFNHLKTIPEEKVSDFEVLMVLRILSELGYVVKNEETKLFLDSGEDWNDRLLQEINKHKKSILDIINKALKESHL